MRSIIPAVLVCGVIAAAVAAQPEPKQPPKPAGKEVVVSEKARAIHDEALLIDGHNDLPWELRENDGPGFKNIDLKKPQMTLEEFNSRHPSSISLQELAIINEVEDPATPLQAGRTLKRVVGGVRQQG